MAKISNHKPSDQEIKGIWSDTYKLFLQYKDADCATYENEINLACETIGDNYENCELAATLVGAVLRVLIDRSEAYKNLGKGVNNGKEGSK